MYYPSFFAGVRPFETLRERVENPLDLSVKQTESRSEGSRPAEHENLQLMIERKLAVTGGLPSQQLGQQMPLLDNMFAYKPFGVDSISCQMRDSSAVLSQNLNSPFCSTASSGHHLSHLGLMPDMLHQSPNQLTMETAAPPLTSYAINTSGIPYHMRMSSAATAAAVMANQRAYYGHNTVLTPHMSNPFSPLPHISLYNDLMARRPVEHNSSVFGTLPSLQTAPDPTTRFSEHLQRLRGQHMQQRKCSCPCCLPSLHSNANHSNNGCNCCDVRLSMPSNVSTLVLSPPHSKNISVPMSVPYDVCNRDIFATNTINNSLSDKHYNNNNNNNENKSSFEDNSSLNKSEFLNQSKDSPKNCSEKQSPQKSANELISGLMPNHNLWNPSFCNIAGAQPIDCNNKHSDKRSLNSNETNNEQFSYNLDDSNIRDIGLKNPNQEVIILDQKMNECKPIEMNKQETIIFSKHIPEKSKKCHSSDKQSKTMSAVPAVDDISCHSSPINTCFPFSHISDHNSKQINDENSDQNSSKILKLEISEQPEDSPQKTLCDGRPKNDFLFTHRENNRFNDTATDSVVNQNSEPTLNESRAESVECQPLVKPTTVAVKSETKQLKDYKPVAKHMNIISLDKHKKQTKETKTVEVQCDGPDWTPIVLPQKLKNKLQKVVRKKLFGKDCKKFSSFKSFKFKRDLKKRRKCEQKHNHRNQSRSQSSSTTSSRKTSPEREFDSNYNTSANKSKKRSMLQCLVNSEGYVADKIKKNDRQTNLFASDPLQLGREERALQTLEITENDIPIDENESNDSNGTEITKESHISKNIIENYEKTIESVVYESRLQNECSEPDINSNKTNNLKDCNQMKQMIQTNDRTEPQKLKTITKRKLRQRFLDEDQQHIDGRVGFKTKKKKIQQNKCVEEEEEEGIKLNEIVVQPLAPPPTPIPTKHKKAVVCRRRRFRSGLDMIRSAHKRKKSRIQATHGKQESNRSVISKTSPEVDQTGNGSVPTEMKRLMVNKALGETLLHRAARSNRLDVVNFCLNSNICDVNVRDNANYTPLHECSTRGNLQIARLLLQNGADVNASAAGGIRPIHDAIENNHIEVVRLLLSYGADPNINTYSGSTVIQLSRSKAMLSFLKAFLSDISSECQTEAVLSWKFNGSSNILDAEKTGFNVMDDWPPFEVEEESQDFLFEISDSPMDPIFYFSNLGSKGADYFVRLSDVLNRTRLTRDEFLKKYSNIEIISVNSNQLEDSFVRQMPTKSKKILTKSDGLAQDMLILDDTLRNIIGIDWFRLQ